MRRQTVQKSGEVIDIPLSTPPPPAPQPSHVDALPVGARLAEFEVQALLGVGGFGMVYRAYDHSLHRTVAIKEYMPSALACRQGGVLVTLRSSVDQPGYLSGLNSFVAEARLLAHFDHPSLVKVYRFWEGNNTAYMVMPLYNGMTLKQARSQMVAPPPERWLRAVLWSVLQALQVLHDADMLHRDVSPDNIFLQDMGPPVLLDLGAARRAIQDKGHKHTAILKVNYAPIEQFAEIEDLQQGPWTDLYSLAAVVYGCLCNDPPMPATSRLVRDNQPSVASVAQTLNQHFGQTYSEAFVATIEHALKIQPQDRPQTVAAWVSEMALDATQDLARFDWRADLGDLQSATDQDTRGMWQTQMQTAHAANVTRRLEAAQFMIDGDSATTLPGAQKSRSTTVDMGASTLKPAPASAPRPMPVRKRWPLGLGLAAGVLGLAALAFWFLGSASPPEVAQPVLASPAEAPVVAASTPQSVSSSLPVQQAASVPTATPAQPLMAASGPAPPASQAKVVPASLPAPKNERVIPAKVPPGSTVDEASRQAERAAATKLAPAPLDRAAEQASGPEKQAQSKPASTPSRALCADSNFFSRPMCIFQECQKAENARLPVCLEERQRQPADTDALRR